MFMRDSGIRWKENNMVMWAV